MKLSHTRMNTCMHYCGGVYIQTHTNSMAPSQSKWSRQCACKSGTSLSTPSLLVCVYVYVRVYVRACVCVYMHMNMYTCMFVFARACVHV